MINLHHFFQNTKKIFGCLILHIYKILNIIYSNTFISAFSISTHPFYMYFIT